jgi:hypothetical protein
MIAMDELQFFILLPTFQILGLNFINIAYWMLTIITLGEFNIFKIVFCTAVLFAAFPLGTRGKLLQELADDLSLECFEINGTLYLCICHII